MRRRVLHPWAVALIALVALAIALPALGLAATPAPLPAIPPDDFFVVDPVPPTWLGDSVRWWLSGSTSSWAGNEQPVRLIT